MFYAKRFLITASLMVDTWALSARDFRIPSEYEQAGSSASGILNAGATEADAFSAVQINPALLVLNREYSLGAAYHWPDAGRNFYRVGVVDGVTSKYAAAATYTGFQEKAQGIESRFERDSLTVKRAALGIAYPLQNVAVGMSLYYLEGLSSDLEGGDDSKGVSLGFGAIAYLTKQIKLGGSVQNLNNGSIAELAPRFYRIGLSWDVVPEWTIFGDIRRRDRIGQYEGDIQGGSVSDLTGDGLSQDESMIFLGNKVKIYNLIRMEVVYGNSIDPEDKRRSLAAGLSLVQQSYSLKYTVSRPYLEYSDLHSAISLQIMMKM